MARVEVAVARKNGKKLFVLRGKAFKKGTQKLLTRSFRPAKLKGGAWSLKLPALRPGTYLIRVRAIDGAGNPSKLLKRTVRLR